MHLSSKENKTKQNIVSTLTESCPLNVIRRDSDISECPCVEKTNKSNAVNWKKSIAGCPSIEKTNRSNAVNWKEGAK